MYKFILLAFLSFFTLVATGQNCLPMGITFATQSEVDDFPIAYPNCTIIEGPVCVGNCTNFLTTDITNLNGLSQLLEVGGLQVKRTGLTDLTGLNNLTKINGSFWVRRNTALLSLNGLNLLKQVTDSVVLITDNLVNLDGLSGLEIIDKGLLINSNLELGSLQGMDSIHSVGFLQIHNNDKLQSITGISTLRNVDGKMDIDNNDDLVSLSGLDSIVFVNGDLTISDNDKIINLLGLNSLERVNGRLIIEQFGITDISDIDELNYTKGLVLAFLQITDLSYLEQLDTIDGDFGLVFNSRLKTLSGLEDLEVINGSINLLYNDSLMNINAISSIDPSSISSTISSADLRIENNSMLSNCSILSICEALTLNIDSLIVIGNATGCNSEAEIETACSALPVIYSKDLKASIQNEGVLLRFSIESQINNSHFEVEHSSNGLNFEQIGIIQGEGTSFKKIDYNFIDLNSIQGANYYRIKQVDFNGSYEYSTIASIDLKKERLQLYSNPVRDKILIYSNEPIKAAIYTSYGSLVLNLELVKGMNEFDLSHLADGIYFMVTSIGEEYRVLVQD